jgi:hypothetical protein
MRCVPGTTAHGGQVLGRGAAVGRNHRVGRGPDRFRANAAALTSSLGERAARNRANHRQEE